MAVVPPASRSTRLDEEQQLLRIIVECPQGHRDIKSVKRILQLIRVACWGDDYRRIEPTSRTACAMSRGAVYQSLRCSFRKMGTQATERSGRKLRPSKQHRISGISPAVSAAYPSGCPPDSRPSGVERDKEIADQRGLKSFRSEPTSTKRRLPTVVDSRHPSEIRA